VTRTDYGWAVRFRYVGLRESSAGYCGRYWFSAPLPEHEGVTTSVFRTRRAAQRAIAAHRKGSSWSREHWRATAVRVRVTISDKVDTP
jgi:hypothetical protein